jgi:hypothetical protein
MPGLQSLTLNQTRFTAHHLDLIFQNPSLTSLDLNIHWLYREMPRYVHFAPNAQSSTTGTAARFEYWKTLDPIFAKLISDPSPQYLHLNLELAVPRYPLTIAALEKRIAYLECHFTITGTDQQLAHLQPLSRHYGLKLGNTPPHTPTPPTLPTPATSPKTTTDTPNPTTQPLNNNTSPPD